MCTASQVPLMPVLFDQQSTLRDILTHKSRLKMDSTNYLPDTASTLFNHLPIATSS